MNSKLSCQQVERLIFEMEENAGRVEIPSTGRSELSAHLNQCAACRGFRDEERKLTSILVGEHVAQLASTNPTAKNETRLAWLLAVCAASVFFVLGAWSMWQWQPNNADKDVALLAQPVNASLGSILSKPIFSDVGFESAAKTLEASNHVVLPLGSTAMIELNDTATINAVGPAIFEVDRIGDQWKLTMREGRLKVLIAEGSSLQVAGDGGKQQLSGGNYLIDFSEDQFVAISRPQDQDDDSDDIAAKLERGLSVFKADSNATKDEQREAATVLCEVFNNPEATHTQRMSAGLYGTAALANTAQFEKVLEVGTKWEQEFGNSMGTGMVSALVVKAHFSLGHTEKANQGAEAFLKAFPDSPLRSMVSSIVGSDGGGGSLSTVGRVPPEFRPPYTGDDESNDFISGQDDGYLVVKVGLSENGAEHQKFSDVAQRVQKFHDAKVVEFAGDDFENLKKAIAAHKPANVLFVIPPQLLDVNFHRQVFQIAPTLDNDLFADFAWGYLTARDGETLDKLWTRIEGLHENGFSNNNWLETSVVGGEMLSKTLTAQIPQWAIDAGFAGNELYFGCIEKDLNVIEFADSKRSEFENASVIAMTGNGDPQGIWLFDGMRNMNSELHWEFDKSKVGQDPNNEMVRLKSDWFRKLNLQSPIVWSGTCHSGACHRVFVEGDIVSTFGKSETAVAYDLPADESLCLAMIDAGAGALLVPIAANHGLSVTLETSFCVKYGATLGEAVKSTYDDVILQAGGVPKLLLTEVGDVPDFFSEPVMQSGGANRILIGDPALRLFKSSPIKIEQQTAKFNEENQSLSANLVWEKGYHGTAWNLFADGRGGSQRMLTRIDCTDMKSLVAKSRNGQISVEAKLTDNNGKEIDCYVVAEVETIGGKSYLHLQASSNDDSLAHEHHEVTFQVSWK